MKKVKGETLYLNRNIIDILKGTYIYCYDKEGNMTTLPLQEIIGEERVNQLEKQLKALEIIKKGCPYISLEKRKYIDNDKPYVLIIGGGYETAYIELTQEEFDLLKEVLL